MIVIDIYEPLKTYFGYDEFKIGQEKLVNGVLEGKDVLGIMPTGGGKSLCYQLPAILLEGLTFVVSPLISLMKDQVDSLNEIGISGTFINSTLSDLELLERLQDIREGKYKIIYVAPERLNTYAFINLIKDVKVSMIAIDEAHCISQWGHDFRPSYVEIPKFINSINNRPVVAAYTATATKEIVREIKSLIGLRNPVESLIGFDRPNLFYRVAKVSDKTSYVLDYLKNNFIQESGIIYCATRKAVESLTEKLQLSGFSAVAYHGGMTSSDRENHQEDFIYNRVKIIVATNAFGMGIDKPDVRFVIHFNMPQNMEAYSQESGRAGRDGEPSDCILLYSPSDIVKQKLLIQYNSLSQERETMLYENLQYLIDYCHTNECLRKNILTYFGESIDEENCNNCENCLDESELVDITIESQKILSCVYRADERYGSTTIIQTLRGSRNKKILEYGLDKISTYGIMKEYSEDTLRELIMTLVSREYIYITADKFPILKLSAKSRDILNGKVNVFHKKRLLQNKTATKKVKGSIPINFNEELYEKLRTLRSSLATEKSLAPFMVFHDSTLKEMASTFPGTRDALLNIKGVGLKKFESYGEDFLSVIKEYSNKNNIDPIIITKTMDKRKESLLERYNSTYELYEENLDLDSIAKLRGYTKNTIIEHLSQCTKTGLEVDWSKFIDEPLKEESILSAINTAGLEKLKAIKELLPDDISYEDIKLVIEKYELN